MYWLKSTLKSDKGKVIFNVPLYLIKMSESHASSPAHSLEEDTFSRSSFSDSPRHIRPTPSETPSHDLDLNSSQHSFSTALTGYTNAFYKLLFLDMNQWTLQVWIFHQQSRFILKMEFSQELHVGFLVEWKLFSIASQTYIKRPLNAYMIWTRVERTKVLAKEPKMKMNEVTKAVCRWLFRVAF